MITNQLAFEDICNHSSGLIYCYKNIGIPGRYINEIIWIPFSERPGIIAKLEISLTNIDNVGDTKYTFWISNVGGVYNNNPNFPQLNRIISEWLKTIRDNKIQLKQTRRLLISGIIC